MSHDCKHRKNCKSYVKITHCDIERASKKSPGGFVISKPGSYKLCENVNWNVATSTSFAITIDANNVDLDLATHYILQKNILLTGNFAIRLTTKAQNVRVRNGFVQQVSGGAILVDAGASNIIIEDIVANRCCYRGETPTFFGFPSWAGVILLNGTVDAPIEQVTIKNCSFADTGILGNAPVWFTGTVTNGTTLTLTNAPLYPVEIRSVLVGTGLTEGTTVVNQISPLVYTITLSANVGPISIKSTPVDSVFIPFGHLSAILAAFTTDIIISNVIVNHTFGAELSFAIAFASCNKVLLTDSVINSTSTFALAKGTLIFNSQNVVQQDLTISGTLMNVTPDANNFPFGHGAEGSKITSSQNWTMRRIHWSAGVVQTQIPTELVSPFPFFPYMDCTGVITDVFPPGTLMNTQNGLIEDCTVQNMKNDGGGFATNPSYTSGFVFSSEFGNPAFTSDIRVTNTIARDLVGQVGWAFGFGSSPVSGPNTGSQGLEDNIVYSNCTAENVEIAGQGVYASGYIVKGIKNQVVESVANFIKDKRVNPKAYGIILDTVSGPVTNSIIIENKITNCDGAGILNLSPSPTNVFNSNYVALNGPGGAGPNYVNLPPSSAALIQDWPLGGTPSAPPAGGPVLANVSVHL